MFMETPRKPISHCKMYMDRYEWVVFFAAVATNIAATLASCGLMSNANAKRNHFRNQWQSLDIRYGITYVIPTLLYRIVIEFVGPACDYVNSFALCGSLKWVKLMDIHGISNLIVFNSLISIVQFIFGKHMRCMMQD